MIEMKKYQCDKLFFLFKYPYILNFRFLVHLKVLDFLNPGFSKCHFTSNSFNFDGLWLVWFEYISFAFKVLKSYSALYFTTNYCLPVASGATFVLPPPRCRRAAILPLSVLGLTALVATASWVLAGLTVVMLDVKKTRNSQSVGT